MLLRNRAPVGAIEIAGYGVIEPGATFTPKPEHVAGLIGQVDNFDTADDEAAAARAAFYAPADETPAGEPAPTESEAA